MESAFLDRVNAAGLVQLQHHQVFVDVFAVYEQRGVTPQISNPNDSYSDIVIRGSRRQLDRQPRNPTSSLQGDLHNRPYPLP